MSDENWHETWPMAERLAELQEIRDARRIKRRHTKMVVDGAGIKKLRNIRRATLGAEPVESRPKP